MGKDAIDSVMEWWKKEKKFTNQDGHRHRLFFRGEGEHARLVMKSEERPLEEYMRLLKDKL